MSLYNSAATASTKLLGYPVQTSVKGLPIPIVYGTQRVSGNVIWTGDWDARPVQSKGKGGGGKGGANQQFDYHSAVIIGLCQGPISSLGKIWLNQIVYSVSSITEKFVIASTSYATPFGAAGAFVADVGVSKASAYSVTNNDYGSPGSTTFAGSQQVALARTSSPTPGPGQYHVDPTTGIYTFNSADIGQQVELSYTWNQFSSTGGGAPAPNLGLTVIDGLIAQSAWSFLTSNHPSQAIGYNGVALAASQDFDLGASGVLSNILFEVLGLNIFGGGWSDAEISSTIYDLITNPVYGVSGFPTGNIGDLTELKNYSLANGLLISPVIDNQKPVLDYLRDMLKVANSEGFWSEGKLKFRTYGDTTAVGNGVTFTPNNAPIYDLDEDDYQEPIKVERKSVKDISNRFTVEWSNRANSYNIEPLSEDDDWSISRFGLRPDSPIHLPMIAVHSVAQKVANVNKKRAVNISNTYTITLGIQYCLLEPMDLVTVTSLPLGLNKYPVRLLSKEEDENGRFIFTAEDFPWGTAAPTLHPKQTSSRFGPGFFAPPGNVHTPLFFEPPPEQTQNIEKHELIIALAGGQDWGGAEVWVSRDGGSSYESAGRQNGPSSVGRLTGALAAHADPDDSGVLPVDLTESDGALASFTKQQEDDLIPLVLVDGELISYRTATLTGAFAYNITHMRRGVFDTPIQAHASGARFLFFDAGAFVWTYDVKDVGKVLKFKFTSFNQSGQNQQDLSDAAEFTYQVKGPRLPYPLNPGVAISNMPAPPDYSRGQFSIQEQYKTLADNSKLAQFRMVTQLSPNQFSPVPAPIISLASVATTGGSWQGGRKVLVIASVLTPGVSPFFSQVTNLLSIDIPAGTNTNVINLTTAYAGAGNLLVYAAYDDDSRGFLLTDGFSGSLTLAMTTPSGSLAEQLPDSRFFGMEMRASPMIPGAYTGTVVSATGNTIKFAGAAFSTNQYVGRYVIKLATFDNSVLGIIESQVISNNADTLTLDGSINLTGLIAAGDTFAIRSQPTSCTARVITDTNWNLVAGAHKGSYVRCIGGTGIGQKVQISDNTTTTVTLTQDLEIVFDSTSILIIIASAPTAVLPSAQLKVALSSDRTEFFLAVDNSADTVFFVQMILFDRFFDYADEILSPFREIFQIGAAPSPGTPDGYFNTSIVSAHVAIEIANGLSQVTLLDLTQITIDNPTNSGGSPIGGDRLWLFFIQRSPGNNPTPLWGSAYGDDIKSLIFDGSDLTKLWTVIQITFHTYDNLWHYDNFVTGK